MTDSSPVRRIDEPARSFANLLIEIESGKLNDDLSAELQRLVATLRDHLAAFGGKKVKGSLTLKLDLTLDRGAVDLIATLKVKEPDAPRDRSLFWPSTGDNLLPHNPDQLELKGIRAVPGSGETRSA